LSLLTQIKVEYWLTYKKKMGPREKTFGSRQRGEQTEKAQGFQKPKI